MINKKKSLFQILSSYFRFRCPVCSQGDLYIPITRVRSFTQLCLPPEQCNVCHFRFRREPGYYFGVLTPLLPILSLMTGLVTTSIYYFTLRPEDPFQLLLPAIAGTAIGFVLFFRPAIAFYIHLDHAIDPPSH